MTRTRVQVVNLEFHPALVLFAISLVHLIRNEKNDGRGRRSDAAGGNVNIMHEVNGFLQSDPLESYNALRIIVSLAQNENGANVRSYLFFVPAPASP